MRRITLVGAALLVVGIAALVWFPASPVALAAATVLYVAIAVLTQDWGMAALGVCAAIAAIWWTLTHG